MSEIDYYPIKDLSNSEPIKLGILAVQGDVREHFIISKKALDNLGLNYKPIKLVKQSKDIENLTHFIIPGGESTVIDKFISKIDDKNSILNKIKEEYNNGLKIMGTCAGAILISKRIIDNSFNVQVKGLKLIDIEITRNSYGRQYDSFETELKVFFKNFSPNIYNIKGIFIRVPRITEILSENVEILAKYKDEPVLVRQNNVIACTFHPELINNLEIYKYFFKLS